MGSSSSSGSFDNAINTIDMPASISDAINSGGKVVQLTDRYFVYFVYFVYCCLGKRIN
jgi:hypothetical protein